MALPPSRDRQPLLVPEQLSRSALAWEILRRDPAYRVACAARLRSRGITAADPDFVRRWGLHFP